MQFRHAFLFLFFTFLFLFYPGDHPYFQLAAQNRDYFYEKTTLPSLNVREIPIATGSAELFVSAQGAYVVELESFTPIYQKNAQQRLYPASTTKVITALVVVDEYDPQEIITVKQASQEGQLMGLVPGEKITVENLLYGILVHSGNDAAHAIAEDYGYDQFIQKMNEKAAELNMKNSYFTNPSGLDAALQQTSAFDLALAARELLKDPYLRKIVGTKEIIISDVDYNYFHTLTNVNQLLGEVQGLGGLKTGYTELAGENLVSFYRLNRHDYIIVILNSEDRFFDTQVIVEWIRNNVVYIEPELPE